MKTLTVHWPDGSRTKARDARDLLARLATEPWNPQGRLALRRELAHRAEVWSGERVAWWLPASLFVRALADAGLFDLEERNRL